MANFVCMYVNKLKNYSLNPLKHQLFFKHTFLGGEIVESISASNEQVDEKKKTFKEKIGVWYFKNRASRECFEELLKILIEENLNMPLSGNSFITHKHDKLEITKVFPWRVLSL